MAVENTLRQLNLLLVLLNASVPLTRAQIFDRVAGYGPSDSEAAQRKFERDKKDLRSLLVFDESNPNDGASDTYAIDRKKSFMPDVPLDGDEKFLISLAIKAWRDAHIGQAASAGAVLSGAQWLRSGPIQAALGRDERHLAPLEKSILENRVVEFAYFSRSGGDTKTRCVEPWKIVLHQAHWYLFGYDQTVDQPRLFRFARIHGDVQGTDQEISVAPPQDIDPLDLLRGFQRTEAHEEVARIAVPFGDCANLRLLADEVVESSGSDVLNMKYIDGYRLAREIALVCDRAIVLEPKSLTDRVTEIMNTVLQVHG